MVGDSGVGKTNILMCYCEGVFKSSYASTIGVDFKVKRLQLGDDVLKFQIWDTAGQERFKNITQTYYKGAAGIILTYSIADTRTFANISTHTVTQANG
jgi:Ras-related protein Rab-8A